MIEIVTVTRLVLERHENRYRYRHRKHSSLNARDATIRVTSSGNVELCAFFAHLDQCFPFGPEPRWLRMTLHRENTFSANQNHAMPRPFSVDQSRPNMRSAPCRTHLAPLYERPVITCSKHFCFAQALGAISHISGVLASLQLSTVACCTQICL